METQTQEARFVELCKAIAQRAQAITQTLKETRNNLNTIINKE